MKRSSFFGFLFLLFVAMLPAAVHAAGPAAFRRGVSVHTMLNWARLVPGDPGRYAQEPFGGAEYDLPSVLIRNVKAAGFDFVRLTIDPGPFLQLRGPARVALDGKLKATVERFLDNGLAVMVDLHSNSHVAVYDPVNWLTSTENAVFEDYVDLVGRTARLLAALHTPMVAIEPMNEPVYGYDPASVARWQQMMETMHAAVRKASPDLLVVVSGARGGSRRGLAELDPTPFRGSNVLYSFHYYEPYVFTHEGVVSSESSARTWRWLSAMPYPVGRATSRSVLDTVRANVDGDPTLDHTRRVTAWHAARAQVLAYLASGFDRRSIDIAFDGVRDWARRYSIDPKQIFLGEFGVTRTYGSYRAALPASREAWLRDVREVAAARGYGWCLWSLSGYGGMALVSRDDATVLDPGTLRALGLRAPEH